MSQDVEQKFACVLNFGLTEKWKNRFRCSHPIISTRPYKEKTEMQKEFFEIGVLVAARETVHLSRGSSGRNSRAFPSSFCEAGEGYPHFLKSSKEGSRRSWGTYMRGFCLLAPCWTPAEPSLATRQSTEEGPRQHWPCPCSAGTCVKQRPGSAPVLEILKMQVGLEHP